MLRTVVRLSPSFIPILTRSNEYDHNILQKSESAVEKTGWERVKDMFKKNEFDEPSKELHTIGQATTFGLFLGAMFGGVVKSRHAYITFIENNQATIFHSTKEAQKKLQDQVTLSFAKGAYHWGWRLGLFSGMFSFIATSISVYRDDSTIVEYVIAGAMTGALYKANLGTAAMLVGGLLGGVLSTVGGLVILGLLKISGLSMAEIRASLYRIREARQEQMNQGAEKTATEKHDDLTRHHDKIIEQKGAVKIEELP
ncbi:RPII140-upstream gene protein [Aricia agestis]|uniref:RPII140-upstream gene protein n=1 Tax=Aricia agestis TaxID=91739 RepID=UPI001C206D30|nr:RPII140-upstream gene protein [Aricia agestis]